MYEHSCRGCLWAVLLIIGVLALFFVPLGQEKKATSRFQANSDDSAIRFFQDHVTDFEALRELIEKHPELVYYHSSRDVATPLHGLDYSEDHRSQIRRLMTDLGISALNGPASSWGIRLIIQNEGWAMASTTKSFYFSRDRPAPLVPSIENYVIQESKSPGVFRPIAPSWYLKMDWGG